MEWGAHASLLEPSATVSYIIIRRNWKKREIAHQTAGKEDPVESAIPALHRNDAIKAHRKTPKGLAQALFEVLARSYRERG
tara:strand:- start:143 stop:385 length:243 start_codon:yes stop_codon:yes gene_type:complete